jgi:2'-5' RNA ligase
VRLFIGVTPPSEAVDHLREAMGNLPDSDDVRWTDPIRWHITLAFLGDVDGSRLTRLERGLDAVASTHEPISGLRLAGAGTFGSVLWVGVAGAERTSKLDHLARATQRAARATGIDVERRSWRAHLTIARARNRADPSPVALALRDYRGPAWTAESITLVHSILGAVPKHRPIHVATLGLG